MFCANLSLAITDVVVGLTLVVLVIARYSSAVTIRSYEKIKAYDLKDLEITQHTRSYTVRLWVKKERTCACSSTFTGVEGGDLGFPQAHSFLVNLKHKSGNLKLEEKKQVAQMVTYRKQPRSLKQRRLNEGR